jgi:hypothetical protein
MSVFSRKSICWLRVQTLKVVVGHTDRHWLAAPPERSARRTIDRIAEGTCVADTEHNPGARFNKCALTRVHQAIDRTLAISHRRDPAEACCPNFQSQRRRSDISDG